MKTALVYDRVNKWGGAERVLLTLHEIFPDAPLYTSVYNPKTASWAKVFPKVIPSFAGQNWVDSHHEWLAPLMPLAFESFNFDSYDLVISVTSEAAKGIITHPGTVHLCYCLTPTRYLWSGYDFYFSKDSPLRTVTKPIVGYLKRWDKVAAHRPDVMIATSKTVQERIKKYYSRDSGIIYPPVGLDPFDTSPIRISEVKNTGFFLIVGRLVPYKRVDLVIEAFNRLKKPLIIVGTGSEEARLKRMAGNYIKFVGQLTDSQLANYYSSSKALIFPQEEDFGIVAIEAQSAGKPVIAFNKGGARETVIPGKTGLFFSRQTPGDLISAIKKFERTKFDSKIIKENAKRFSKERFKKEFIDFVRKTAGKL